VRPLVLFTDCLTLCSAAEVPGQRLFASLSVHRDHWGVRCRNRTLVSGGSAKLKCPLPNGEVRQEADGLRPRL